MPGAGAFDQAARTLVLIAAEPLANRGRGGQARGGLDATLAGRFDNAKAMVVCVFHLKHQIEITSGAAMALGVYSPRAAWLSPQPGGHLLPPLLGVMGLLAAMLAVTGVFGMAMYSVSKRIQEFSIRVALGAQPVRLMRSALGRPLLLLLSASGACFWAR